MSTFDCIKFIDFGKDKSRIRKICDTADEAIAVDANCDDLEGIMPPDVNLATGELKLTYYGYDFDPFFNKDQVSYLMSQANKIVFKGGDKLYIETYFKINVDG